MITERINIKDSKTLQGYEKGDIIKIKPKSEFEYNTQEVYVFDGNTWIGQNNDIDIDQLHTFSTHDILYWSEEIYDDDQNMADMVELPTNGDYRNRLGLYADKDKLRIWHEFGKGRALIRKGSEPINHKMVSLLWGEIEITKRRLERLEALLTERIDS